MSRGQATVEYLTLVTALVVGVCLLVRFETPVRAVAEAVAHAVAAPHRRARFDPRPHTSIHRPHPPRRPTVHRCLCPGSGAQAGSSRGTAR
jgi:hypothetical protein